VSASDVIISDSLLSPPRGAKENSMHNIQDIMHLLADPQGGMIRFVDQRSSPPYQRVIDLFARAAAGKKTSRDEWSEAAYQAALHGNAAITPGLMGAQYFAARKSDRGMLAAATAAYVFGPCGQGTEAELSSAIHAIKQLIAWNEA
jgi:hypothetical protein